MALTRLEMAARAAKELYVSPFMPFDVTGSLDAPTYAAIVVYVMSVNGATPGAQPFSADSPGLFVPAAGGGGAGGGR